MAKYAQRLLYYSKMAKERQEENPTNATHNRVMHKDCCHAALFVHFGGTYTQHTLFWLLQCFNLVKYPVWEGGDGPGSELGQLPSVGLIVIKVVVYSSMNVIIGCPIGYNLRILPALDSVQI